MPPVLYHCSLAACAEVNPFMPRVLCHCSLAACVEVNPHKHSTNQPCGHCCRLLCRHSLLWLPCSNLVYWHTGLGGGGFFIGCVPWGNWVFPGETGLDCCKEDFCISLGLTVRTINHHLALREVKCAHNNTKCNVRTINLSR
jgi:hypothetical protein